MAERWHGRGVATVLLGAVAQRAASEGIETLTAIVMPENHAMIGVFRDSGFPVSVHARPGELHVELGTAVGPDALRRSVSASGRAPSRRSTTSWRPRRSPSSARAAVRAP